MNRTTLAAALGFAVAFLLGFVPPSPPRHATPNSVSRANIYIQDPYVTNTIGNITGKTPPSDCGPTQAIGMYDDGGSVGINCLDTGGATATGTALNAPPATPSGTGATTSYFFALDAGWPSLPYHIDSFDGLSVPTGLFSIFRLRSTTEKWDWQCHFAQMWGRSQNTSVNSIVETNTGSLGGVAWANTTFLTRMKVVSYTSATALNSWTSIVQSGAASDWIAWRGNTAGAGGFYWWSRVGFIDTKANIRFIAGLSNVNTAMSGSSDPNVLTDSVYFGCNDGDTNLSICSNDNSGTATCTSLGSSFPCTTDGAYYDFFLGAPPNDSFINYYVERLDSVAISQGVLTSDLPRNTLQMGWKIGLNTGGSTTTQVIMGFHGTCGVQNL